MSTQTADQTLLHHAMSSFDEEVKVSTSISVVMIPDQNQGSYSGLINFDATNQLTGNTKFASLEDSYLVIPYTATIKLGGTIPASPKAFNRFTLAPKFNVATIIDSLSVELNNKKIISEQSFKQYWSNLRAWTETTPAEIMKHGADTSILIRGI